MNKYVRNSLQSVELFGVGLEMSCGLCENQRAKHRFKTLSAFNHHLGQEHNLQRQIRAMSDKRHREYKRDHYHRKNPKAKFYKV